MGKHGVLFTFSQTIYPSLDTETARKEHRKSRTFKRYSVKLFGDFGGPKKGKKSIARFTRHYARGNNGETTVKSFSRGIGSIM